MSAQSRKILIAGAGIGGLTTAAALLAAGFDVEVFERAPALAEVGAGLTVQANAMKALSTLGLDRRVREAGCVVRRGRVQSVAGRVYFDFEAIELGLDRPSVAIHRAVLQGLLFGAVGAERVHLGRRVSGYRLLGDGVAVELEGGEELAGAGLIGADGIHSAVRAQMLGDGEPRYAGYTCWRGLTADVVGIEPGEAFEIWGAGRRLGGVHVDSEQLYWFAPVNAPAGGCDEPGATRDAVLAHYAGWPARWRRIVEGTPEEHILRNDIVDRPFSPRWGDGPVTLLGDAAHPMTPNMGQGACQAIEDAVVLGGCFRAADGDIAGGMRAYENQRRQRARWFVERSWTAGRMAQWQHPIARAARALILSLTPRSAVLRGLLRAQAFQLERAAGP